MEASYRIGVLSDIHYACAAEQARGHDYEAAAVPNRLLRALLRLYRHFIWLRDPMAQGYLLDHFIQRAEGLDWVIANGDYSCDSAFVGLSDPAAFESARTCLQKLRQAFAGKVLATYGDHELGKVSFVGGCGGMRLASWRQAREGLGLEPFWQMRLGRYVFMGVVSSLVALPVFEADTLPAERSSWKQLRAEHLAEIGRAFDQLAPRERVLLFCHDPTALHFLGNEPAVKTRLHQIEHTIIGHLHSNLVLWKSRWLAGMPRISFLGHTAKRLTAALRKARDWRPFNVRLCPSLAGIELLKDGGYLSLELDPEAGRPPRFRLHPLPRLRSPRVLSSKPAKDEPGLSANPPA